MPIVAIAIASTLSGCVDSEKDLYNPSYQTGNPMGDGFAAPDGFDWSTTTTKTVSVEVKDEFDGQYYYTVDIYNENPLYTESATKLASGVAKKGSNYVVALDLLKSQQGIYVKQTDPKGRVAVYMFDVPEENEKITCKLYYSNTQSRALATRGAATRATSFEKPDYTSIPSDAQELTESTGNLQANTSYKITNDYNGTFTFWGHEDSRMTKVFVDANWTIPNGFTFQNGIEIIVMGNGKIESSASLQFVRNSMLTVMDNGTVNFRTISFTNGKPAALRNWGTFSVSERLSIASGATLYNKGTLTSKNININSNSQIVNDNIITIDEDVDLPSNFTLENNGEFRGGKMTANSNAVINNNNVMAFESIYINKAIVNNACSMEATSTFELRESTTNFNQGYVKARDIHIHKGKTFLNNGSMIEATNKITYMEALIYGRGENTSLIKSPTIDGHGFSYYENLAIEADDHVIKLDWGNYYADKTVKFHKLSESTVFIEVCTGIKNDGNGGTDPTDPNFPIITTDTQNYAYMFEDQWPLYGDYDMNDIVLIIKEKKIYANKDNKVERVDFSLDLSAAGATKGIGAAIMLDAVPASSITQPVEFADNSLAQNFNTNSNGLENGQDYAVIPLFDNAHSVMGSNRYEQINTFANHASNTNPRNISFSIKFNNPTLTADAFKVSELNVFIIVDGNRNNRKEIHVVNYQPTKLANTDLFGGNNDGSSISDGKYYISNENLAWGIMVPTDIKWPLEYVNIKAAYSQFEKWVTTGGTENLEWWKNADSSKVF